MWVVESGGGSVVWNAVERLGWFQAINNYVLHICSAEINH